MLLLSSTADVLKVHREQQDRERATTVWEDERSSASRQGQMLPH